MKCHGCDKNFYLTLKKFLYFLFLCFFFMHFKYPKRFSVILYLFFPNFSPFRENTSVFKKEKFSPFSFFRDIFIRTIRDYSIFICFINFCFGAIKFVLSILFIFTLNSALYYFFWPWRNILFGKLLYKNLLKFYKIYIYFSKDWKIKSKVWGKPSVGIEKVKLNKYFILVPADLNYGTNKG